MTQYVEASICESLLCRSLNMYVEASNCRSLKLSKPQMVEASNCRSLKLSKPQIDIVSTIYAEL